MTLIQEIQIYISNQVDYYQTHEDAGEGYKHLLGADFWAATVGQSVGDLDQHLAEWMKEHEIQPLGLDSDTLRDLAIENMVMRHSGQDLGDNLSLVDWPLGEIEIQIEYSNFKDCTRDKVTEIRGAIDNAYVVVNPNEDSFWAYAPSDDFWSHELDKGTYSQAIKKYVNR